MRKAQVIIDRRIIDDESPDPSHLDQDGFADRKAEYIRGDFHFVGVQARATIRTPYGADWIESTITTPGLWGIESDSGDDYFEEVFQEEKETLLEMLESIRNYEILN